MFELVWTEWNWMVAFQANENYYLKKERQDRSKQDGIIIVYEDNLLGNVLCPSLEVPKNQRPR